MDLKQILSARIKLLRENMKMSQDEFIQRLSISKRTLASYEAAETMPNTQKAIHIAHAFNVEADWLSNPSRYENNLPIPYINAISHVNENVVFPQNIINIPVFEAVAGCGAMGMVEQLQISEENFVFDSRIFPTDIITKDIAMIRIVGDSMAPYLDENDWAIIELRNGREVVPIEAVYLIAYDGVVQIKRVQIIGKKAIIKSDNKEYDSFELGINDFDIVGKIIGRLKFGSLMMVRG